MYVRCKGFSLVELLVVMVILAMTSSLLVEGVSSTWRNFERLSSRDILNSKAQLPISWFEKSVEGAVLYHPFNPMFNGNDKRFILTSTGAPNDPLSRPLEQSWYIIQNDVGWSLLFELTPKAKRDIEKIEVKRFDNEPSFEYLVNQQWVNEYIPSDGFLPQAIRVTVANNEWVVAKVKRPTKADVPAEMALFGKYEF